MFVPCQSNRTLATDCERGFSSGLFRLASESPGLLLHVKGLHVRNCSVFF